MNVHDQIEQVAKKTLPWEDLEVVRSVPVFMEHTSTDREGKPLQFSREHLEEMVQRQNERALKGLFAPISRGHTVAEGPQPEVVGYCGNCRLSRIGDRWGIVCDEYRFKSDREWFKRNARRSAEVWNHPDTKRRFFDPVAALGAETPRLDLPMRFSRREHQGFTIEKYSGEPVDMPEQYAATFAAGANTHVPTLEKFEMNGDVTALLESLKQILAKLESMSPSEPVVDPVVDPVDPVVDPIVDPVEEPVAPVEDEMPENDPLPFSRQAYERLRSDRDGYRNKYQMLQKEHEKLSDQHKKLQEQHKTLDRERADAQREKELYSLSNERVFDLEAYRSKCLYSMGSQMSDQQFADTVDTIRDLAPEAPEGAKRLPRGTEGEDEERPAFPEKYSKQTVDAAMKLAADERKAGRAISFEEACRRVEAEQ